MPLDGVTKMRRISEWGANDNYCLSRDRTCSRGGGTLDHPAPFDLHLDYGEVMTCQYDIAWYGKCGKGEGEFCEKHAQVKCVSCGAQATHECCYTGQFVCGAPLCNDCVGVEDESKSSGGWGFLNHYHKRRG